MLLRSLPSEAAASSDTKAFSSTGAITLRVAPTLSRQARPLITDIRAHIYIYTERQSHLSTSSRCFSKGYKYPSRKKFPSDTKEVKKARTGGAGGSRAHMDRTMAVTRTWGGGGRGEGGVMLSMYRSDEAAGGGRDVPSVGACVGPDLRCVPVYCRLG